MQLALVWGCFWTWWFSSKFTLITQAKLELLRAFERHALGHEAIGRHQAQTAERSSGPLLLVWTRLCSVKGNAVAVASLPKWWVNAEIYCNAGYSGQRAGRYIATQWRVCIQPQNVRIWDLLPELMQDCGCFNLLDYARRIRGHQDERYWHAIWRVSLHNAC
jgi:hypothetical protein